MRLRIPVVRLLGGVTLAVLLGSTARAEEPAAPPSVPAAVRTALRDYLEAPAKKEKAALARLLSAVKGDLAVAAEAIRASAPLGKAKPGTEHGLSFESGGHRFEYSVRLPKGYDGKKRFPALVLPDHESVDAEAGIGFWDRADGVDDYVLFRPVILRHREDPKRFPQAFFPRDAAIAQVMRDALAHLRLHYAVDPERLSMTGLSQAGFYTWYFAVSFPDQFAAIVPESAGGIAVRASVLRLAQNLSGVHVRILHTEGDQVTPYGDAVAMRDALATAKAPAELLTYRDADYGGTPFPNRHPGPHHKRIENVLPWAKDRRRAIPASFTRVVRYAQQGDEGRFFVPPPDDPTKPLTVTCAEEGGRLSADAKGVAYRVSPEDVLGRREFQVGARKVVPKPDLELLFRSHKALGDTGRLFAAEIDVGR